MQVLQEVESTSPRPWTCGAEPWHRSSAQRGATAALGEFGVNAEVVGAGDVHQEHVWILGFRRAF